MNIEAKGEYVLIKKDSDEKATESGIIYNLKENKHFFITGEVLSIGVDVKLDIKIGDRVIAQRIESIPVLLDETNRQDEYQFVNYKYVYAKYQ